MQVSVTASPDMKFSAVSENGAICPIGASEAVGGDGSGFRPMQLLLGAMASCAVIDTVLILKKMKIEFSRIDITVNGERSEGTPSPFKSIDLRFKVIGADLSNLSKAEKAVALSVEKYCSVAASLDPKIVVKHHTEILA
jgi:putative redox protein